MLTHWGRVTHICVGKLIITGSDNGLSPGQRQAIIWTNAEILLIGPLGTNFSEIVIEIRTFSFSKNALANVACEMVSILLRPQCVNEAAVQKKNIEWMWLNLPLIKCVIYLLVWWNGISTMIIQPISNSNDGSLSLLKNQNQSSALPAFCEL